MYLIKYTLPSLMHSAMGEHLQVMNSEHAYYSFYNFLDFQDILKCILMEIL